ncbi:glycoside hydrolase family 16 protein [Amycolatopsis sp. H20-H5]|uniref:glycoside hydrolase family 16 protein n=1 Tax=Amycolatopsis sp. H20-H5 TaxID=3046309 RepID=UPI002DB619C2|nr:glycoside hydrolase family 16 protein [Amycolatopsis sp. H20-H5]MEC3981415.1 glycoside hydrolase family 16 protein [Amycolatopsis sp. H20-H5]
MPVYSLSSHLPPRGKRRRWLTLGAVLGAALIAIPLTLPASASVPPPDAGWTQVFADDFTGANGSLPSGANWIYDTGHAYPGGPGNWGTGEIQNYTTDARNLALDGAGNLRITPQRDGAGNWTSARIETQRGDFKPPAGGALRIESRVQMPNVTGAAALGYWPAFWALGSPYRGNNWNWPSVGEFDIMENVNGINSVWGVLHCGVNPGGPCDETTGIVNNRACPGATCQAGFHTYRFEWDASSSPQVFRWFVDGQQFHSVAQNQVDATTWANMTNHAGYFVLLNVAIGGAFPDNNSGTTTPGAGIVPGHPMVVDYVSVSTRGGGGTTTPPTTPPTPPSTTPPTPPTPPSTTPGGGGSAYSTIQAESYSQATGLGTQSTTDTGGGQNVGPAGNGDSALYPNVDFGPSAAHQFQARVASGAAGGVSGLVEVRLDSPAGPPVGSFAVADTGGWQSWRTVPANISAVTGVHNVYLTFTSGQPADFVNVNWFTFGH